MAFRGYLELNGCELVNSSRVASHLGVGPVSDDLAFGADALNQTSPGLYSTDADFISSGLYQPMSQKIESGLYPTLGCSLEYVSEGLFKKPDDAIEYEQGLYLPTVGSCFYGPGLFQQGPCWDTESFCGLGIQLSADDSWVGLKDFLKHNVYRIELAPWYSTAIPESAEFAGIWCLDVVGLDSKQLSRDITPTIGDGAVAGRNRDSAKTVTVTAILIGSTNAGLSYGMQWLADILNCATSKTGVELKYLCAHPNSTSASPNSLWRTLRDVVLTRGIETEELFSSGYMPEDNCAKINFELTATNPHTYLPSNSFIVDWDEITEQSINWVHDADCVKPESCGPMPILFSSECQPQQLFVKPLPPPVCGGCLPVGGITSHVWRLPALGTPTRGRKTCATLRIANTGNKPLNLQGFWRISGTDIRCEQALHPFQISGLPEDASLTLDAVSGRMSAWAKNMWRKPIGIVGTPNGGPWRPAIIDRRNEWELHILTGKNTDFDVELTLTDREP